MTDLDVGKLHLGEEEPFGFGNHAELLRLLECPICSELQMAPIYNCELGHSLCNQCRKKMSNCPICARPFTYSRNYLAESIAEAARIHCPYQGKGCREIITVVDEYKHSEQCQFRPVLCQLNRINHCVGTKVELPFYLSHLKTVHDVAGRELKDFGEFCEKTERISVINEGSKWPPFYIMVKDKEFLKNTVHVGGSLYWWLTHISVQPEEADKFQSKIVIKLKGSERLIFTYSVPVHHFRRNPKEIIESGECAALPLKSLLPFCRSEEHQGIQYVYCWDMMFSITKFC